jgi:hypothetical protein
MSNRKELRKRLNLEHKRAIKELKIIKKTGTPEAYRQKYDEIFPETTTGYKERTKEDREKQVEILRGKLNEVGFYPELSGFEEFVRQGELFIEAGKIFDSKIEFVEAPGAYLQVLLHPSTNIDCSIIVKNWRQN